jgi:hypothetical protein
VLAQAPPFSLEKDMSRHRVAFDISERTYDELGRLIPFGLKGALFSFIADELVKLMNEGDRIDVLASVLRKRITVSDLLKEGTKDGPGGSKEVS